MSEFGKGALVVVLGCGAAVGVIFTLTGAAGYFLGDGVDAAILAFAVGFILGAIAGLLVSLFVGAVLSIGAWAVRGNAPRKDEDLP